VRRVITVIDGRAYYMSTGTSTSRGSQKEAGQFYAFRGIQQAALPQSLADYGVRVNWLIKGPGITSVDPVRTLNHLDYPIRGTFTRPAEVNAWLRARGVDVVDDVVTLIHQLNEER